MSKLRYASACLAAMAAAGCVSAEPAYFALEAQSGAGRAGPNLTIELRKPGLAGYLDRSEIVSRVVDMRLQVASGERWGEPLGDMIGRVLTEDLTARLPGSRVFSEGGAVAVDPDMLVDVDVQRFEKDSSGSVTLLAQVAVEHPRHHVAAAEDAVRLTAPVGGGGTTATVKAMSGLLGELSDRIAALVATAGARDIGATSDAGAAGP